MDVTLGPELEELVRNKVKSGRYLSESEVVREALWLLDERDQQQELQREELSEAIARGIEQADRGELLDGPAVFDRLRAKLRSRDGQGS